MVHTSCSGLFERCSAYVQRKFKPAVGFGTCAVTVAAGTGALAKSYFNLLALLRQLSALMYHTQHTDNTDMYTSHCINGQKYCP